MKLVKKEKERKKIIQDELSEAMGITSVVILKKFELLIGGIISGST